jgi:hypothetical protein
MYPNEQTSKKSGIDSGPQTGEDLVSKFIPFFQVSKVDPSSTNPSPIIGWTIKIRQEGATVIGVVTKIHGDVYALDHARNCSHLGRPIV